MSKQAKRDIALVIILLALCAAAYFAVSDSRTKGNSCEITVSGERFGVYSLAADRTVDVNGLCTVEIKDGKVRVASSSCANKTCVSHNPVNLGGEAIICLPNAVVVRVLGGEADFVV
ncbi:MAG: NusG domain II-containing protein [Clostridia bacterium]|nr:NusG domain II-containing protein [Clostridia bacterium]